jgi:hypothetical protein
VNPVDESIGPMVKVGFRDLKGEVESLWAFDLGGNRYRLDNSSWLQYGVSYKDIVEALPEADGMLFFTRVLEKSGHRTVRVHDGDGVHQSLIDSLIAAGCSFEGANRKFIAFDIPPAVSLQSVVRILEETHVTWEHADPTYEELHGGGA